ncbi:MAG: bifunctional adenosylcobinamide kinase/adenosylcobinamide-phosphate guanylyltransferase, partial [Oscillospiraceae bacterium]|nr:bifunctional adenosylcobinamide kinase/adenosylcobinamide-phosphate guanylyltransferase [Oscillospiraceae bacterium]
EITELIWQVKEINGVLLIISLELGLCPVPCEPDKRVYRKMMGNINQRIAGQASEVYLMVSGIASKIK